MKNFSIIIVTWNNLPYLKKCVEALNRFSLSDHEIIIHINEGSDGTVEWVKSQNLKYTHSLKNVGVCSGANAAAKLATRDWICMHEDDMFALPNWDTNLIKFYNSNNFDQNIYLCSTMIEPAGNQKWSIKSNFGKIDSFEEERLLNTYQKYNFHFPLLINISSVPMIISRNVWKEIEGYDTLFDPAPGAELGFAKKCWDFGIRDFVQVNNSLVYHFQTTSTKRLQNYSSLAMIRDRNFRNKYDMERTFFVQNVLKKGHRWLNEG